MSHWFTDPHSGKFLLSSGNTAFRWYQNLKGWDSMAEETKTGGQAPVAEKQQINRNTAKATDTNKSDQEPKSSNRPYARDETPETRKRHVL